MLDNDQVFSDICLPSNKSRVVLTEAPYRWDEYLDLDIPILISSSCCEWNELERQLEQSGLSTDRVLRLVESSGAVKPVTLRGQSLEPHPDTREWTLVLNWTHGEEGGRARLPLAGRTYLVTRQKEQGEALAEQIRSLGGSALSLPTIDFVAPDDETIIQEAVQHLSSFDWILFTSPNGVRYFFRRLEEAKKDHRSLGSAAFACIGPRTADSLAERGFYADVVPDRYVAEGLLEALQTVDMTKKKVLIPRAQVAREVLPDTLTARGAEVVVAPCYKTVRPSAPDLAFERQPERTRLIFTSSSTVRNWVDMTDIRSLPCFCIGPVTAQTADDEGLPVLAVAEVHTVEGLLDTVLHFEGTD